MATATANGNKKRKLALAAPAASVVATEFNHGSESKKQRVEQVASVAKDVMIRLLSANLNYDVTDDEYEKLVQLTQAHPKFDKFFTFPSDTEPGWVKAKAKKRSSTLRVVALDCEMCVTVPLASGQRVSNALCRVSAVDGDDMIRNIISDYIVHQPEPGSRMLDPKTDIHGITLEMIAQSKISVAKAQKQLLKYINADTIIVGHSVHGDLASLRLDHRRVIDTAMIYQRKGESTRSTPGLKCLTKFLLDFEMPDGHDSTIDAQASMLAAKYAARHEVGAIIPSSLELHGPKGPTETRGRDRRQRDDGAPRPSRTLDPSLLAAMAEQRAADRAADKAAVAIARSCRLRMHRIPKGVTSHDIEQFFLKTTNIVPTAVEAIQWLPNQNRGSCSVTFASTAHASLAFETAELPGNKVTKVTLDSIGRSQKNVAVTNSKGTVFSNIMLGVL